MIDREKIIKLIQSYLPDANDKTLNRLADDIIHDIIPVMHTNIRKAANEEKSKIILQKVVS